MVNYQNGKIYSIRSYQTDDIYIGSTCQILSQRMGGHRRDYKVWLDGKRNKTTSYDILQYADAYIELVEKFPCNSKQELEKREGEIIRETKNCINKCIAGIGRNESMRRLYENKREERLEYQRLYYIKNRERITELNKTKKVICGCGGSYTKCNLKRHNRTMKHKEWILSCHNIFNHL